MTKKENIITKTNELLDQYTDKLTVRQIYYRLVSFQIIENTKNQYKYFDSVITKARKDGIINPSRFVDLTRKTEYNIDYNYTTWKEALDYKMYEIRENPYIFTNRNLFQKDITVIMLEKQTLETIFKSVISNMCVLIVNRGFNSFTQLYELALALKNEKRNMNLYTFSDYDISGFKIESNFINQCKQLGIKYNSIERIALTESLIDKYDLPINPEKTTPFKIKEKLRGNVELDALEPNTLKDLVRNVVKKNYDKSLYQSIVKYRKIQQKRLNKHYAKELRIFAENLLKD